MLLRGLTVAALLVTIALALRDALSGGGPAALGEIWFALAPGSLNLAQAIVQRYISPAAWDPAMIWLLGQPAAAVFGVVALALVAAVLERRRGRG